MKPEASAPNADVPSAWRTEARKILIATQRRGGGFGSEAGKGSRSSEPGDRATPRGPVGCGCGGNAGRRLQGGTAVLAGVALDIEHQAAENRILGPGGPPGNLSLLGHTLSLILPGQPLLLAFFPPVVCEL